MTMEDMEVRSCAQQVFINTKKRCRCYFLHIYIYHINISYYHIYIYIYIYPFKIVKIGTASLGC